MALSSFSNSGLSRVVQKQIPWALISNTPTGSYTSGGVTYNYYTFTGNGTLTVTTAGYIDVLVCGGGGGGGYWNPDGSIRQAGGGGGGVRYGILEFAAGSFSITVGAGGASGGTNGSPGSWSGFSTTGYWVTGGNAGTTADNQRRGWGGGGGGGAQTDGGGNFDSGGAGWGLLEGGTIIPGGPSGVTGTGPGSGITSSITGSSVEYGVGGRAATNTSTVGAGGASQQAGTAGRVIVRVGIS